MALLISAILLNFVCLFLPLDGRETMPTSTFAPRPLETATAVSVLKVALVMNFLRVSLIAIPICSWSYSDFFLLCPAVETLRAAGIFMSVSAGNSGSGCSTISDPPATEASVITVGATAYNSDAAATYSSRGPVSGRKSPNIAAPGSTVRSCVPGGGYSSFSGTRFVTKPSQK